MNGRSPSVTPGGYGGESTTNLPSRSTIVRRGAVALGGSIVGNLLVLAFALVTLGSGGFDPLAVGPVTVATAIGVVGAVAVYALFVRLFAERADRRFVAIAAVVCLASFVTFVEAATIPGATTGRLAALGAMHVVPAVVCVAALTRVWR